MLMFYLCTALTVIAAESVKSGGHDWPTREFRGVWIATVANIDWPLSKNNSPSHQKAEMVSLLDKLHELNFNAIFFQVRSVGDAMYQSAIEPWSVYLTGEQGKAPSPFYDPLQFIIDESHKRNIEVHTWFNPYRARLNNASNRGLAPNHMAVKFPQYAYAHGKHLWMDPGAKEVQDQCTNVIMDVVKRYDIDGVVMDDYFYPYPISGHVFPDYATFHTYTHSGGQLSRSDWRRKNVDDLIQRLYNQIKTTKRDVKFGLSPFGIWKAGVPARIQGLSSYSALYADSQKWFNEGWVDYMSPQLYWQIDPPQQSFTHLIDWWLQQNSHHHHLYTGSYAGNIIHKSWPVDEIRRQVEETRKRSGQLSLGLVFFSAKYFRDNNKGLSDMFKTRLYTSPALAPVMPWLTSSTPQAPSGCTFSSGRISWQTDTIGNVRSWAVYRFVANAWHLVKVANHSTVSFIPKTAGKYAITAVDRLSSESDGVVVTVKRSHLVG